MFHFSHSFLHLHSTARRVESCKFSFALLPTHCCWSCFSSERERKSKSSKFNMLNLCAISHSSHRLYKLCSRSEVRVHVSSRKNCWLCVIEFRPSCLNFSSLTTPPWHSCMRRVTFILFFLFFVRNLIKNYDGERAQRRNLCLTKENPADDGWNRALARLLTIWNFKRARNSLLSSPSASENYILCWCWWIIEKRSAARSEGFS